MATQVTLQAEPRDESQVGKGPAGRLRKDGRVPAILYGADIGSIACHVDALELYHAMRTEAGLNVLIRLQVGGDEHLSIVRDFQRHAVRGNMMHVDFQNVDRNTLYPADIPVHLENEDVPAHEGGIVNLVLYTVPIQVTPLEIPNEFVLDVAGLSVGDVLRVADLADQLPEGASFDIDEERTVVTINAPMSEEALEAELEADLEEGEEPLVEGEEPAEGDAAAEAEGDTEASAEDTDGDE
jgi:large subunit ribosomal protein L25